MKKWLGRLIVKGFLKVKPWIAKHSKRLLQLLGFMVFLGIIDVIYTLGCWAVDLFKWIATWI